MALTGIQIYKYLPKTNCGECGAPTCLAFAMKLAGKKAELAECPYVSDEGKSALGEASAPPIRLVCLGTGANRIELGNETVLFRHEQTFYHPTGLTMQISDDLSDDALRSAVGKVKCLCFERIGMLLKLDLIALKGTSDAARFTAAAKLVVECADLPVILMHDSAEALREAAAAIKDTRPLLYAATADNWEKMGEVAQALGLPLAVAGRNLDEAADLAEKLRGKGLNDLVIDSGARQINQVLNDQTHVRRLALKKQFRPLGYPTITFALDDDPCQQMMKAATYITKYAGITVIDLTEPWQILPLVTLRQNIYTDPQKPIQVEPKLYAVGNADENSPVLVTTNFSLTYFVVAGEVEASKIPAWVLVVDTEGTSVLTAWAADKFNAEKITKAIRETGIEEKVKHRRIILPGYVAVLSAPLKDESGWEVFVGPKEAAGIPTYLKSKGPNWTELATAAAPA
jgi:acetyl-CoA decarbonylase/synthase complex subunit gamma